MQLFKKIMENTDRWLSKVAADHAIQIDEIPDDPVMPRWRKDSYIHQRADKSKAETAINAIYKQCGLKAPMIIWTQSPIVNVLAKAEIDYFSNPDLKRPWNFRHDDSYYQNEDLREKVWQSLDEAGWKHGDIGTGPRAWDNVQLYEERTDICWKHMARSEVYDESNELRYVRRDNVWYIVGDLAAEVSDNDWLVDLVIRYNFAKTSMNATKYNYGNWPSPTSIQRDKSELRYQNNLNCLPLFVGDTKDTHSSRPVPVLPDIQALRDSAGWVMPYTHICFVSERPEPLHLDDSQRLHCETGQAISFPDGFELYMWHGTQFPKEWVKTKPTASEALSWTNLEQRRVACEMLGWETILNELEAVTINKDDDPEIGELVSVNIPDIGEEKFLRVTCGTGRQFALMVPPDMATARQANAWTWGLESHQYKPDVRT